MKKFFVTILSSCFLLTSFYSFAQVPQRFNYQGIARDAKGNPMSKQQLALKLAVLPTFDATAPEYEEIQHVLTNEFGLYTLQIGNGTALTGEMKTVKWETGNKYIKVMIDTKGGTDFVDAGTTQLLSVPYAIYADKAGMAKNTTGDRTGTVSSNASHLAGDANFITKFTGLNLIGKSQVFDNGTNIGIGTTSPLFKFHIQKPVGNADLLIRTLDSSAAASLRLRNSAGAELGINKFGPNATGTFMGLSRANMAAVNNFTTGPFVFNSGSDIVLGNTVGATQLPRLFIKGSTGSVGINTINPSPSAILELNDITKGFLMPRMTTVQRDLIASPATGLQIMNLDDQCIDMYDGSNWMKTCGMKVVGSFADTSHPTQNTWVLKSGCPFSVRNAVAFAVGNIVYVATGRDINLVSLKECWAYNPATNIWSQKADFGGSERYSAIGFAINDKGYLGTGTNNSTYFSDFWEFDPQLNTWTAKANLSVSAARAEAVGLSINAKGYIATGTNGVNNLNDLWEYDPLLNTWIQKANFGGISRAGAVGFSIDNKGYIGTGRLFNGALTNDFWEYNPSLNTWTQKANYGGGFRTGASGFSLNHKGYIGTGLDNTLNVTKDFWLFDPILNQWIQKADWGSNLMAAIGVSIGNKGYLGIGSQTAGTNTLTSLFKEYMDDNTIGFAYTSNAISSINNTINDGAWTIAQNNIYNSNSGNIGIRTTAPHAPLHFANNSFHRELILSETANNEHQYIGFGAPVLFGSNRYLRYQVASTSDHHIFYAGTSSTASNELMRIQGNGSVGIGASFISALLTVNGTAEKPGGGSWAVYSDKRLKSNIIPYTDGLSTILKISPVKFHYNEKMGVDTKPEYVGVIAQDLQEFIPYMVDSFKKNNIDYLRVDNSAMTYMLINAMQEQQKQIEAQKKKLVNSKSI